MPYNSTLRAALQAAINTPANPKISGAILQQQLLAMVNAMEAGAVFMGAATPATSPTGEANCFYLAATEGTYTHFLDIYGQAITIGEGEAALLSSIYDGSALRWKKNPFPGHTYLHIMYSIAQPAQDSDMHATFANGDKWIGICADDSNTAPTKYDAYQWAKFVGEDGEQGTPGHNPNCGTYTNIADAPATGQDGDYIVVVSGDPATGIIYKWDSTANDNAGGWVSTGAEANEAEFATGQKVFETPIDETHIDNPESESLTLAVDAMLLKNKLRGINSTEVKYGSNYAKQIEGFIACRTTSKRTKGHFYTQTGVYTVFIPISTTKSVRFLFSTMSADNPQGYCFLNIDDIDTFLSNLVNNTTLQNVKVVPADNTGEVSAYQVDIDVPNEYNYIALYFGPTNSSVFAVNADNFYCYTRTGNDVIDTIKSIINSPINNREVNIMQTILSQITPTNAAIGSSSHKWTASAICYLVPIKLGDKRVKIQANASNDSYYSFLRDNVVVIDEYPNYVSGVYSNIKINAGETIYADIPSDAKYLYIQDTDSGTRTPQSVVISEFPLYGKKMAFIGDSITYGYGLDNLSERYSSVFSKMAGCTEVNLGVSGTCLCTQTKNNRESERFVTRATQLTIGDCDIVLIWGGTNDFSYDSQPIGDLFVENTITGNTYVGTKEKIAPTDTDKFAGALHELLSTVRTINPNAKVICLNIMNRGVYAGWNINRPTSFQSNANGDFISDFNDAINKICAFYAIPVVDIASLINQNWAYDNGNAPAVLQSMDLDGIHPNTLGHYRIAKVLFDYVINNRLV